MKKTTQWVPRVFERNWYFETQKNVEDINILKECLYNDELSIQFWLRVKKRLQKMKCFISNLPRDSLVYVVRELEWGAGGIDSWTSVWDVWVFRGSRWVWFVINMKKKWPYIGQGLYSHSQPSNYNICPLPPTQMTFTIDSAWFTVSDAVNWLIVSDH